MSQTRDRLKRLEDIEKDIVRVIRSAGETISELSKDMPSEDIVNSRATEFVKSLEGVERGLSEQISYLTQVATGQPHEGSAYGIEKDLDISCSQMSYVGEKLKEIKEVAQKTDTAATK